MGDLTNIKSVVGFMADALERVDARRAHTAVLAAAKAFVWSAADLQHAWCDGCRRDRYRAGLSSRGRR